MNRSLFLFFVGVVSSLGLNAQFVLGLEAGPLLSNADLELESGLFDLGYNSESDIGFYAGPTLNYELTDDIAVDVGAFFSLRRATFTPPSLLTDFVDIELRQSSLEVPLRISGEIDLTDNMDLLILTGPSLNFNLDQNYEANIAGVNVPDIVTDIIDPDNIKTTEISWKLGTGIEFEKFSIIAQYNLGLSDLSRSNLYNTRMNYFSLGLNYSLTEL